jgi:hypothetical protein
MRILLIIPVTITGEALKWYILIPPSSKNHGHEVFTLAQHIAVMADLNMMNILFQTAI